MKDWKVTSKNRTAAKRLLNTWYDSRAVRVMPLAELDAKLLQAVNNGYMTHEGVKRALGAENKPQAAAQDAGAANNAPDNQQPSDDERDAQGGEGQTQTQGEAPNGSNGTDEQNEAYAQGQSDASNGMESEADYYDESTGERAAYEQGYEDGKSEQEFDGEGEGEQEQEQEQEQDSEQSNEDENAPIYHPMFDAVKRYIAAGLNVALVGPAGSGKSYLSRQVADHLGLDFYVNGALMSKYDLIGYKDAHGEYHSTPAYEAFTSGGLHCFDELDASAPEAVVAFNGMTDDQPFYTFPNGQATQHEDYVAIACMNTYGNGASADYVGRFKQDAASMSRFVKVFIDYDKRVEQRIAGEHTDILKRVWMLREACNKLAIRHIVSTRMVVQAVAARGAKVTRAEIDRDIFFAGLDDNAIKQVKAEMTKLARGAK